MKRQWPLTWCTVIHARGEDCKYYLSRAEPEDAAQIMGRLALASKSMTKGGWPEEMQSMQWGSCPENKSIEDNDELRARHTRYLLAIIIRLPLA